MFSHRAGGTRIGRLLRSAMSPRNTLLVGVMLAALGVLAACSAGDPETPSAPAATDTPATGEIKRGGTVEYSVRLPRTFDPAGRGCGSSRSQAFYSLVHDSLIGHPTGPGSNPVSPEIVGYLAESWEAVDAKTYRFTLRADARFADVPPVNGRAVTSADVKFSLERYAAGGECAPETASIASIDTPDERTVVVHLKEDFAPWLDQMAESQAWILPKEAGKPDPDAPSGLLFRDLDTIIGAGPFISAEINETAETMRFTPNANFYNADLVYIDAIETNNIADYSTEFGKLMAGELEWLGALDIATLDVARGNSDLVVQEAQRTGSSTYYFSVSKPPFDDVRVRRAIALAYDQSEFLEVNGGGVRRCGLIGLEGPNSSICSELPAETLRWWQDEADDIELAKQLLAEAGFPDGFDMKINISSQESLYRRYKPELFAAQLARIGINAEIELIDQEVHRRVYMESGDWTGIGVTTGGPNSQWNRITALTPDHELDFNGHIDNLYINERVAEFRVTVDPERRNQLLREIGIEAASQVYVLHIPTEPRFSAWSKTVKNFVPAGIRDDEGRHWVGVWLDE